MIMLRDLIFTHRWPVALITWFVTRSCPDRRTEHSETVSADRDTDRPWYCVVLYHQLVHLHHVIKKDVEAIYLVKYNTLGPWCHLWDIMTRQGPMPLDGVV